MLKNKKRGKKGRRLAGEIYKKYKEIYGDTAVSQRRVSNYITDLSMFDIIETSDISRGRYGKTRKIRLKYPPDFVLSILNEND